MVATKLASVCVWLHPRHRHNLDNLDPASWHLQMRMPLAEKLCRRTGSLGLDDRISSNIVLHIRSTFDFNPFGFSKRPAALHDGIFVISHPFHPGIHPFLLLLGGGILHHLRKRGRFCHV